MRKHRATTIGQENLEFLKACMDGLITYHAVYTCKRDAERLNVTMQIGVNAAMLFRDEGRIAEMTTVFLNQGLPFLLVACGVKWPETVGYAVMPTGEIKNPSGVDFDPIWSKPCRPSAIAEIIHSALEEHLTWKVVSWKGQTTRQEYLLAELKKPEWQFTASQVT